MLFYSIQDANGNATTCSYDSHDRPYDTTFPDSSYERNVSYDGAGNVLTFRNRAEDQITATFDALNRQLTKSHSSFQNITYGYDLLSRQTSVSQTGGQPVSYVFEKAGRATSDYKVCLAVQGPSANWSPRYPCSRRVGALRPPRCAAVRPERKRFNGISLHVDERIDPCTIIEAGIARGAGSGRAEKNPGDAEHDDAATPSQPLPMRQELFE